MTKEFLVEAYSEKEALKILAQKFTEWRQRRDVKSWRWMIAPESRKFKGRYRAYARMVAT